MWMGSQCSLQTPRSHSQFAFPLWKLWAGKGITTPKHITANGKLLDLNVLRAQCQLPEGMFFRFLQLQHAFSVRFPLPLTLDSDPLEWLLASLVMGKPLSSIYLQLSNAYSTKLDRTYWKWVTDLSDLTAVDWDNCVNTSLTHMISTKDCFIQFKCLHRV